MNIQLRPGIFLSTEHSASSYGQPVLVIDGTAYGVTDAWGIPLLDALGRTSGYEREAAAALKLFRNTPSLHDTDGYPFACDECEVAFSMADGTVLHAPTCSKAC